MGAEVYFIVNPIAGHGRASRVWPEVSAAFRSRGVAFDEGITGGPGDAAELAARAVRAGYRLVVSVGGDGTLNEVVNGLFVDGAPDPTRTTLGIISCGTGCDLVKTLGIPRGIGGVEALFSNESLLMDVARATFRAPDGERRCRYFANAADLGVGVEITARVNRGSKRLGGFLSFAISAVTSLVRSRPREIRVAFDDEPETKYLTDLIIVANGRYAGGGMMFAPRAEISDGLLDVVALEPVSRLQLLLDIFPKVYSGRHLGHRKVIFRQARRLVVSAPEPLGLEMDGELPGEAPAEISVLPRALRVAVPGGSGQPASSDQAANARHAAPR